MLKMLPMGDYVIICMKYLLKYMQIERKPGNGEMVNQKYSDVISSYFFWFNSVIHCSISTMFCKKAEQWNLVRLVVGYLKIFRLCQERVRKSFTKLYL